MIDHIADLTLYPMTIYPICIVVLSICYIWQLNLRVLMNFFHPGRPHKAKKHFDLNWAPKKYFLLRMCTIYHESYVLTCTLLHEPSFAQKCTRICSWTDTPRILNWLCLKLEQIWEHFYYRNGGHFYSKSGLRFALAQSITNLGFLGCQFSYNSLYIFEQMEAHRAKCK